MSENIKTYLKKEIIINSSNNRSKVDTPTIKIFLAQFLIETT